jgi:hypothetical protein
MKSFSLAVALALVVLSTGSTQAGLFNRRSACGTAGCGGSASFAVPQTYSYQYRYQYQYQGQGSTPVAPQVRVAPVAPPAVQYRYSYQFQYGVGCYGGSCGR